jgi:hypothetical protein
MKQDKVSITVVFWFTTGCSPVGGNTVASEYTANKFGSVIYEFPSSRQDDITERNLFHFLFSTDSKIRTHDKPFCRTHDKPFWYYVPNVWAKPKRNKDENCLPYITLTVFGFWTRARSLNLRIISRNSIWHVVSDTTALGRLEQHGEQQCQRFHYLRLTIKINSDSHPTGTSLTCWQ